MKTAVSLLMLLLIPLLALAAPGATAVPPPDLTAYPWAFWREPPPEAEGSGEVTVIFVGDVLLGRGVDPSADPLRDVTPWLSAADLTIGNLEGYIAPGEPPIVNRQPSIVNPQSPIHLPMPVTAVAALRRAGFDLLSVANNHSLDGGTEGLQETVTRLRHAGLHPVGLAGSDPVLVTAHGVRLAFFAFNTIPPAPTEGMTPAPQFWDAATAVPAIQAARAQADAVIVLMHWGFEYEARPDPAQERIAQTLLDAGADLVVGQHPHVAQPVAVIGDGVVAYSLGNFLFDQDHDGLALRAVFAADGLRGVQLLPVRAAVRPYLLPLAAAQPLLQRVLPPPPRIGFACTDETCVPVDVAQTAQSGQFYSGQIDLTGDGKPETVRREGERIIIY
ncbi:MAG: CapA family protein, partial [Anaerolinea sp.]|nr:CapA family protein [Anaerolinea sp.]